ncbi:MAG: bifunctional (p)ppGpp synthetase/guanosine-3',5'-bis(diphosphate) 3'-pyrophosphohydrolase, partial [Deltaproteobacteria bacterium]|nr:bifunctional (p)ppGpp synthetase/guanosine-3',5'-bis(diphosphate) 3'-pyrophosphohydrolase [Deltaproteobacteria bacterium]
MIRVHDILDAVSSYIPDADLDAIRKAYVFAAKSHQGQTRRSGEPYLVHPLEVAGILTEMRLDVPSIVASLLHDTVEDTVATLEEIERHFGAEVKSLVDGVTKLSKIRFSTSEEKQAENFRKMIMAMAQDIRVILIKVADRLHNMRTLQHLAEDRQVAIAQETLDIYAPIANRLGLQQIKVELEDHCLRFLKPEVFRVIDERMSRGKGERDKQVKEVQKIVGEKLNEHQIKADISGRMKHYYSIHRKMVKQGIPLEEVHDIIAFRVIVDSVPQCYETLGVIHSMWHPIPGRFKDYIAMPKANHYQSLHTTVVGHHGERMEFQIRTREMHDICEHGIAAHWKYKEGRLVDDKDEMKFKWIRRLLDWQRELSDPTEFLDTVKLDLFSEDVYVFTPKGELREYPRGSTPLDFAYSVHTDVGNSCVGARVNGKIVPLRYLLRSGDTIEIITQKNKRPNKDWLQMVRTSRAKAKIRQYLRIDEHEQSAAIGRELLEKAAGRAGLSLSRVLDDPAVKNFAKEASYESAEALLVPIGYGKISPVQIVHLVAPEEKNTEKKGIADNVTGVIGKFVKKFGKSRDPVRVGGISNMLVSFGRCCN